MDDKRIELMKNAPVGQAINHLALPATIGLLVVAIYNFVDTMFVAWLGTEATGATQVVMPLMMLFGAFGLGLGMGASSYVSRLLGMNNKGRANEAATVTLYTGLVVGTLAAGIVFFALEPILSFFGASDSVMVMAKAYGRFIIVAGGFQVSNMVLNNLLRGEGSAKLSMIGMGAGALLNIILDPIFIFTFGLGIAGAAIATSISQVVTFVILISRYLNHHSVLRISPKYFKPSLSLYGEILKVGLPTLFRQVLFSVTIGMLNQASVAHGGDDLLAATGVIFKTIMVPNFIVFGFGQGFQPVVGYNYGAGVEKRVMEAFIHTIKMTLAISTSCAVILLVFDDQILSIFRPEAQVHAYCVRGFRLFFPVLIFVAVSNTIAVFYQALGKAKESLILSVARQGIFFIPALLIMPRLLGTDGVLLAQTLADAFTLVLSLFLLISFMKSGRLTEEMAKMKTAGSVLESR